MFAPETRIKKWISKNSQNQDKFLADGKNILAIDRITEELKRHHRIIC
jgi:cell wall assembly regulator SMI1